MNKRELINSLRIETNLTQNEADAVTQFFFDEMSNALANGDRVEIRGLCSFFVKKYKTYTCRKPESGETIKIKPKKLPYFKCGRELMKHVDY